MALPIRPTPLPFSPPIHSRQVAVIGAGAGGLVTARELQRGGHNVVVFERGGEIGGTWVYTPTTESDPLGVDPTRSVVHSSLYASLRTNLPRESMGFQDFPFVPVDSGSDGRDPRRFPGHREVLHYLRDFSEAFGLTEMVRFETEVCSVKMVEVGRWEVRSRKSRSGNRYEDEMFDAVVVCNGHHTEPRLAEISGIDNWPGKQMHSHNYRIPEPFEDQVVILIGNSASAHDLSREIATIAKQVHIAARSEGMISVQSAHQNIWFHSMIDTAREDGSVIFQDGSVVHADVIIHCTGYKYHFPFLDFNGVVSIDDNRVYPLYKHVFPPALAPWLSFVGLPWKIAPFPLFELQSKWISGILSGQIALPSQEDMMRDVESLCLKLEASGIPKRYTHNISDYQFEYNDWLAAECGCAGAKEWRKQMYDATSKNRHVRPNTYRDEWEDAHLILEAHEDFVQYSGADRNGYVF